MARKTEPEVNPVDVGEDTEEKVKLDPAVAKMARLLREIATCYRDAAKALTWGDDVECQSQLDVAGAMRNVFDTLSKRYSESITADELAEVNEL